MQIPNFVPVVDLAHYGIKGDELRKKFGFPLLITSSYLYARRRKGENLQPIHTALDYDGPIMTDSGAYQILAYGNAEVTPKQAVETQQILNPDIGVILDVPTPPNDTEHQARAKINETLRRAKESAKYFGDSPEITWTLPIQGGRHLGLLREYITEVSTCHEFEKYGFYALGSIVPLMNSYEFGTLFSMTRIARELLPESNPLHLFGAGHPMIFAFAVALGADTFDSAAYALFAEEDRYMTATGTRHLKNLRELPCSCPICNDYTADELRQLPKRQRVRTLEEHNLYVTNAEMKQIRNAIRQGDLWEHLRTREKSHPQLYKAFRTAFDDPAFFLTGTPMAKSKGMKFFDAFDTVRPEVTRIREFVLQQHMPTKSQHVRIAVGANFDLEPDESFPTVFLHPIFGPIPEEMTAVYPVRQSVLAFPCEFVSSSVDALEVYLRRAEYKSFELVSTPKLASRCVDLMQNIQARLTQFGMQSVAETSTHNEGVT